MALTPPSTLGRYEIIREISRSNDIVYEGFDPVCNRRIAVKEANFSNCGTPEEREDKLNRFRREAEVTGALSHRNIMGVYDYGEDNSRCFLVLELLNGRSLRNILDTGKTYGVDEAFELIRPILEALEYAHDQGVVHRDLKPDNIQILTSGEPKLIDFGIARIAFKPNLTTNFVPMGTPSYMSFEQLKGLDIDYRTDLYSVSVILYELISGVKPFTAPDLFALMTVVTTTEPSYPSAVFKPDVIRLLQKGLSKRADDRFQSAHEMLDAFRALTSGQPRPIAQPQISVPQPVPVVQPATVYSPAAGQIIMPVTTPAQNMVAGRPANPPNIRLWKHFPIICSLAVVGLLMQPILGPTYSLLMGLGLSFLGVYWVAHNATRRKIFLNDLPSKALLFLVGVVIVTFNRYAIPTSGTWTQTPSSSSQQPLANSGISSPQSKPSEKPSKPASPTTSAKSRKQRDAKPSEANLGVSTPEKDKVAAKHSKTPVDSGDDDKPLRGGGSSHDSDPEQSSGGSQKSGDDEPPLRGGG